MDGWIDGWVGGWMREVFPTEAALEPKSELGSCIAEGVGGGGTAGAKVQGLEMLGWKASVVAGS